jgi:hypothetical protein
MSVEDAKRQQALANEARRKGLQEWEVEMSKAVPDDLVRSLVNDFKHGPSLPSSMAQKPGPTAEVKRGTGWQEDTPLRQPPGVDLIDRMVATQDKINAAQKVQELSSLLALSQRAKKMP